MKNKIVKALKVIFTIIKFTISLILVLIAVVLVIYGLYLVISSIFTSIVSPHHFYPENRINPILEPTPEDLEKMSEISSSFWGGIFRIMIGIFSFFIAYNISGISKDFKSPSNNSQENP